MPHTQDEISRRLAPPLLCWYRENRRLLPFRVNPTPYGVWVSEIMLQQTRVAAALEHYRRFMAELPTIAALAECDEQRLLKLWEGLGYYSRARNLQKAAQVVMQQHGGQLPADYKALRALPGIGDYTAGAIGSICFGLPVPAVDGNVLRVFSRLYDDDGDITRPDTKRTCTQRVLACMPPEEPGDFNQALMELGALVCLPGSAVRCAECPAAEFCRAKASGRAPQLPVKAAPKARRLQPVTVLLVQNSAGEYLLQQRGAKGLLAGLWQPFLLERALDAQEAASLLDKTGLQARYTGPGPIAKHIFSHIEWQMHSLCFAAEGPAPAGCVWADRAALDETYPLPGAFCAYRSYMMTQS